MKKLVLTVLTLTVAISLCSNNSLAQEKVQGHELVDLLLEDFLEQSKLPGISITVRQKGETVYAKGFGFANVESKLPMTPETQIRAASVSKVITVTALGRLVSEGKLDLDAPIGTYVPQLQEPFASLTSRQIAGHTAGVQNRPPKKNHKKKHYETIEETLALFKNTRLTFEPNSKYEYSSNGYNLLAAVIEGVSGKPFLEYMENDVFGPLGMTHTARDVKAELTSNDAKMYYFRKGKLVLDRTFSDGTYKLAGAGFKTSSSDLVKMMSAYANGFIDPQVVETMFSSNQLIDGSKTNVGIGWRLNKDINGRRTIEHAGSRQGARTVVVYYPDEDLTLSLMINAKCNVFIEETAHLIAQIFLKEEVEENEIEFEGQIDILSYDQDGKEKHSTGSISIGKGATGKFVMNTESEWIKDSNVISLGGNDFAISTDFGLLYLKMNSEDAGSGKVFLYQLLGDKYHTTNIPFLRLTSVS